MLLTLLFAAISGGATALCVMGGLSPWWILPVWVGFCVTTALVYLLLLIGGLLLFLPKGNPSPRVFRFTHRIVKPTLRWVLSLLQMQVKITGTDKLPHAPYLLVGNHRSAFDPLCTMAVVPSPIVFVAKPSVMKIPIIGKLMERLCFMAIDRDNARNAVATIKRSAELIKDVGLCVGIYPEGTRSKDGSLLPLHAGSFKIAKMAECPVAVVSVRYKKGLLPWSKRTYLHVVDVMDAAFVAQSNTVAMAERTKQALREDLGL